GGGHEMRRRAGTENILGIAGFGATIDAVSASLEDQKRLEHLRDKMESEILRDCPQIVIFGTNTPRAANVSVICLNGMKAENQLMILDLAGIAVGSGSACSSGKLKPSHVLTAMGANESEATCSLRISLGWA